MLLKSPKKIKVTSLEKKPTSKKVATKEPKVAKVVKAVKVAKVTKAAKVKKVRSPKGNIQQTILDAIKKSTDSISIKEIVEASGLATSQIYSVTGKLKKAGIINSVKKGSFALVK